MKVKIIAKCGDSYFEFILLNESGRNLSLDKAYTFREAAINAAFIDDKTAIAAQIMTKTLIGGENFTTSSNAISESIILLISVVKTMEITTRI